MSDQIEGRASVALDLMKHIGEQEEANQQAEQASREYWFRLYLQCIEATHRASLERVLDSGR